LQLRSQPVHAVAGIGNPQRFFEALRTLGLNITEHAFADHHQYTPSDLEFGDQYPVLMTEKDAVKCRAFAQSHFWYLPVSARLNNKAETMINHLLDRLDSAS
ncbi:MAG: tetraacyldisaccharide 4'-kinase, partial [Salinisphaeraceae bacterium]|nr:tetraacyldisaccharide 4'-kinase [Salinisphaeraceae bacterium]